MRLTGAASFKCAHVFLIFSLLEIIMKNAIRNIRSIAFAAALMCAAVAASAQSYQGANVASIDNHTRAEASVNGAVGSSFTVSRGEAGATAAGSFAMAGGSIAGLAGGIGAISGDSTTRNLATSYNVSAGAGVGAGASYGWGDSAVTGSASYTAPGQSLQLAGSTDTGSIRNNPNGSDVRVQVTTNQDGGAAASTHGSFAVAGYVVSAGGTIAGAVSDVKYSEASAETFRLTFTGAQPAGMAQAGVISAGAAAQVDASAHMADPIH